MTTDIGTSTVPQTEKLDTCTRREQKGTCAVSTNNCTRIGTRTENKAKWYMYMEGTWCKENNLRKNELGTCTWIEIGVAQKTIKNKKSNNQKAD